MASDHQYQPLDGEERDPADEKSLGVDWSDSTQIIPTHTRSFIIFMSIFLISISANVLLVLDNARLKNASRDWGKTKYSGITFDTQIPFHSYTEFWNPNISREKSDAAWDAIETNPMAVSLHDNYAKDVGLAPSTRFPWDTERSIYYIKGFHDLHCLKFLRKAIMSKHYGENQNFSLHHLFHCLDGLRQNIMCTADDTPMPAPIAHHVGDGQLRRCRDWSKLTAWATRPDQHACHKFDDYREATNTLELFAYCPEGSPYGTVMEAYFAYHGHKDPYEGKAEGHEVVF
ncbi:hypothetical protein P280DRAFT_109352 [Massarina eburnea CBS 473.64]|uniref:Uncharacterized protein n=1 Tax=Massarina eburnea CBS 473.64 TaxID=1395130 RepID=A0A6A6RSG3_9PLEO|nr:hypothetical protein P280DRAFT_109352 [Massarina eburnea CBS 473.64]